MNNHLPTQQEISRRIKAKKWMGDDAGSWAVFIDGRMFVCGLTRSEVDYFKRAAAARLIRHS